MSLNILVLGIYIIMMVAIGLLYKGKTKTINDFFLGGGNVSGILSAFAYGTTYFSAVMFTLCGSLGFQNGISVALIGIGNAFIGGFLAWKLLAKRTKRLSEKYSSRTLVQLVKNYFDSDFLGAFMAVVIFVFLVPYSASVYQGLSILFEQAFGISFVYCAILLAVTTAFYVYFGGNFASMVNSFIQGLITLVAVVVFYFVFFNNANIGGITAGLKNLAAINPSYTTILGPTPLFIIATVILTSFGPFGLPQMSHKFFCVKESEINKGAIASTIFCLVIAGGMYFLGGFSPLFFKASGSVVPEALDKIMPLMLSSTATGILFAILFVMLLASSMSTLSSLVLVTSQTFVEDIMGLMFKRKFSEETNLKIMKIMCLVAIFISVLLALIPNKIIVLLSLSWGTISATCMAPYIYALFSKTRNKLPATASSLVGFFVMIIGVLMFGKEYSTYIACVAFASSFIALLLFHFLTKEHIIEDQA